MKTIRLTMIFSLLILLNSCGVITKTRYGNGFKLNIESNLFSKGDDKKTPKSKKTVKTKDEVGKNDVKIGTNKIETNDAIDFNDAPSEREIVQKPISISSRNLLKKCKSEVELNEKIHVSSPEEKSQNAERKPIEPNTEIAGWLFYGSIAVSLAIAFAGIYIPFLSTILGIMTLVGFILALVGLRKIRLSGDKYSGYGLAVSIIAIYAIALIISLLSLILFLALFL